MCTCSSIKYALYYAFDWLQFWKRTLIIHVEFLHLINVFHSPVVTFLNISFITYTRALPACTSFPFYAKNLRWFTSRHTSGIDTNAIKICYDKVGNLPNKGRIFNKQTWGKIVYFLFVWLVGIDFRQNFFCVLPNFGDFGAKMSFFHYIINQKRNNFIKHCPPPPPPRVPRSR